MKRFNKDIFLPDIRSSLALEDELKDVQRQLLERDVSGGLEAREAVLFNRVQRAKLMEEEAERQKSRMLWLDKGDHNTAFFHKKAKGKRCINSIVRFKEQMELGLRTRSW